MKVRAPCMIGLLMLAGCGKAPQGEAPGGGAADKGAPVSGSPVQTVKAWLSGEQDDRPRIFCAMEADVPLAQDCPIETGTDKDGRTLILHRPGGGFRRLRVAPDGTLQAADGAGEVRTARQGGTIGVVLGAERYAVPAAMLAK